MLIIKTAATLTVFAANVCVYVCIVLLYQLAQCREDRSIILMNYIKRNPLKVIYLKWNIFSKTMAGVEIFCLKFAVLALQRRKVARRLENLGKFSSPLMLKDVYEGSPAKTTDPIFQSRQIRGIPDICHFFTQAKFLENKMYTEKRQFFALNL